MDRMRQRLGVGPRQVLGTGAQVIGRKCATGSQWLERKYQDDSAGNGGTSCSGSEENVGMARQEMAGHGTILGPTLVARNFFVILLFRPFIFTPFEAFSTPIYVCNLFPFQHFGLVQRKGEGDLRVAEEYYSRAILAEPEDGEVLSQYAKLIWESQHDKERATNYFERAIQASSENSHIQAAYASFLWDVEDEEENNAAENTHVRPLLFRQGSTASATA